MYRKYILRKYILKRQMLMTKKRAAPFLISLCGILSDYTTTFYALNFHTGFYETHPQYSPIWAILIFWGAITILTLMLPKKRPWNLCIIGLASTSFIGAINNLLVLFGLFPGIAI